jgi:hypothetical protein
MRKRQNLLTGSWSTKADAVGSSPPKLNWMNDNKERRMFLRVSLHYGLQFAKAIPSYLLTYARTIWLNNSVSIAQRYNAHPCRFFFSTDTHRTAPGPACCCGQSLQGMQPRGWQEAAPSGWVSPSYHRALHLPQQAPPFKEAQSKEWEPFQVKRRLWPNYAMQKSCTQS